MATYDSKPSIYEANGDGSYTYRWNIKEVNPMDNANDTESIGDEQEQTKETPSKWECNEVVVWGTVTREKLTTAVLNNLWNSDYEAKLINDYNAAKESVFGSKTGAEAQKYIDRYKTFLNERKEIKTQIVSDCELLNIV